MFLCSEYLTNDQLQTSHVREVLMMELADKHTFDFQVLFIDMFVNFKKLVFITILFTKEKIWEYLFFIYKKCSTLIFWKLFHGLS